MTSQSLSDLQTVKYSAQVAGFRRDDPGMGRLYYGPGSVVVNIADCGSAVLGSTPGRGPSMSTPPRRSLASFLRKGAALILVVSSLTAGMIGVGLAVGGNGWGWLIGALAPVGIWAATLAAPEAGTSGYCDDNL